MRQNGKSYLWSAVYDRPFLNAAAERDGAPSEERFELALFNIGLEIIGGVSPCLDIGHRYNRHAFPSRQDVHVIRAFVLAPDNRYCAYANGLEETARQGLEVLTLKLIQADRGENGFDYAALQAAVPDFERVWQSETLLDPRLAVAEEAFVSRGGNYDPFDLPYSIDNVKARNASLQWLAKPYNAERLAMTFLYSRLAPHLGTKPDTLLVARRLSTLLDRGYMPAVTDRLRTEPESYLAQILSDAKPSPSPLPLSRWMPGALQRMANLLLGRPTLTLTDSAAFRASVPDIVADYKALKSGSWLETNRAPTAPEGRRTPEPV